MENKEMLTGNNRDLFHPESILGYKMLGELWMVMGAWIKKSKVVKVSGVSKHLYNYITIYIYTYIDIYSFYIYITI